MSYISVFSHFEFIFIYSVKLCSDFIDFFFLASLSLSCVMWDLVP